MEIKVCRGCFREWNPDQTSCPHCGWNQKEASDAVMDWTVGAVFEKRYLLGMCYCEMADKAVWRMYDNLLGISLLALRTKQNDTEELQRLAECLERLDLLSGNSVKILAVKKMSGKWTLLFSVRDAEEKKEQVQAVLQAKDLQEPEAEPDFEKYLGVNPRKEQALCSDTMLDERYRILDCIGIGGFGIVYLCQDLYLKRLAAVKEYFPAEWAEREESFVSVTSSQKLEAYRFGLQSFYEEAKITAKFLHTEHIVTIYDVVEANDTAYLVMEYISGISIGREMRARDYQPYDLLSLEQILFPVMDALEAMHEERLVHSDVSPGNIMRAEDGSIYLIDLGAAKYALSSRPVLSAAFLKIDYAAPEQYRTAREGIPRDEGPWTDVYALGATTYYLLTGQKPPDVIKRLGSEKTKLRLPKKPKIRHAKQWEKWLGHAMEPEITARIASIEQFREEGRELLK